MGEFKDRMDQLYDNLMDRLAEEGYEDITNSANNAIVDLMQDYQLEDAKAFNELVNDSKKIIEKEKIENE
ncbi:hypothetical protein [Alkaliphilus hydrothermalis]|uniref:Phage protein n=1 Tax=Alkaliphilus hydrothermalis TaxID=1482730 RepID=A0ABS2NR60_9FIRM|nr:hypothetical protein [Alkaliphilus hydrothermalis]MBM7615442.1 hypothetical protein [Alkaliphilus hydrothermalis]